jgi:hypothetical protein
MSAVGYRAQRDAIPLTFKTEERSVSSEMHHMVIIVDMVHRSVSLCSALNARAAGEIANEKEFGIDENKRTPIRAQIVADRA